MVINKKTQRKLGFMLCLDIHPRYSRDMGAQGTP